MAEYYYTQDGERQGPIPETELIGLIRSGSIGSSDYYWTQGMADWQLVGESHFAATSTEAPETAPTPTTPSDATPFDSQPLVESSPFDSTPSTAITPSGADPVTASPATSAPSEAATVFGTGTVIPESHSDTVFVKDVANALPKPLWLILPGILAILVGIPYLLFFLLGAIYIWIGVLLFQVNGGLENARRTGSARELMAALGKINTLFVIVGVMTIISIALVVIGIIFVIAAGSSGSF